VSTARSRISPDCAAVLDDIVRSLNADVENAFRKARSAVRDYPDQPMAFRLLALVLRQLGDIAAAERAELRAIELGLLQPAVVAAEKALAADKLEDAERLIRPYLRENPEDAGAALILGTIAERCGAITEAENLYRRATLLAPAYLEASMLLAKLLYGAGRYDEALDVLNQILARSSEHLPAMSLTAAIMVKERRLEEANKWYQRLVSTYPHDGRSWMNYAYLLKTVGRIDESIDAYRQGAALEPGRGSAWWGLANLKTFVFSGDEVAQMRKALELDDITDDDRIHLHFALGKALGDAADYVASFDHYDAGNRIRLAKAPHDADRVSVTVCKVQDVFTRAFVAEHVRTGCLARDPIFIVSLPRSGSTLVEQILASHSQVEGTEELFDIERIALELAPGKPAGAYLDRLGDLDVGELAALGQEYMNATRKFRKTGKPFFTDKMPGNWIYIALINSILPNAKIVDVRRNPLDCGFANFAQQFNWGINFAYDLTNIGRYYREYVKLMSHFDSVIPRRIHRVFYENLVDDTEFEIRRLLEYLDLPFDPNCLRFFENRRAVHTPSSEQVRRPINRDGMDKWRHYDPWLGPLKAALGNVLDEYPAVPAGLSGRA